MALIRTGGGSASVTPTFTTLFTSSGAASTVTLSEDYDELIVSVGGTSVNTSGFTFNLSGTHSVDNVVGTASAAGAGYTQYRTVVNVWNNVKANDSISVPDLATSGGTVIIGVKY